MWYYLHVKNQFLTGLASVDPFFPINKWDRLLPQAEMALNLLRTSKINPNLYLRAILHGNYDFNKHPIALPGTKVVVHSKPSQWASWDYHGEDVFYIDPALEHYQCVQYMTSIQTRFIFIFCSIFSLQFSIPYTCTISFRTSKWQSIEIVSGFAGPILCLLEGPWSLWRHR